MPRRSAEGDRKALCPRPQARKLPSLRNIILQGFASAEATKGLCGRPLETFALPFEAMKANLSMQVCLLILHNFSLNILC